MIDIFMLIMIIVLSLVMIVASFYLLVYYSHPDDSGFGSGLLCKIFGVLGLFLCWSQVLLLPLDVANSRGKMMNFRMDLVWQIIYICIFGYVFVLIPLLIAIYELDPEYSLCKKIRHGFCFFIAEIIVVIVLFTVGYMYLSTANIPIREIECGISTYQLSNNSTMTELISECTPTDGTMKISVSFVIFGVGLMSFISYFLFSFFGGIGLVALPLDMIYKFITRPKKIKRKQLELYKNEVVNTAKRYKEIAVELKKMEKEGIHLLSFINRDKRAYTSQLKKLKAGVNILVKQFEFVDLQRIISGRGVLSYYLNLVGGIILGIASFVWILQIVLYVFIRDSSDRPYNNFLNDVLVAITDKGISFVAVAIFGFLCFYLLWATMKGNIKFGLRFPLIGTIHEMKKDETYMNSILFNIGVMMICSVSVNQFCVKCFNEYAAMTDVDLIFSTQIKYLTFFQYFFKYNIFEFILGGIMLLSLVYLLSRPSDIKTVRKILLKQIEKEKDSSREKMIEMEH